MSINSVSFGTRPYGYNPRTGKFDPEQAKKDFRPGLIDPEAVQKNHNRRVKVAKVLTGMSLLAAGIIFRKPLAKYAAKGIEYVKPLLQKGVDFAKPIVKKGIDFAKPLLSKGAELAKSGYNYVVTHGQNLVAKLIKMVGKKVV